MAGTVGGEVPNHVQTFRRRFEIFVGELAAVGHREIGARHFNRNDADFRIARGDFGRGEIAGRHIVVIPEIQMNRLAARE